jgi:hypothetical protein
LFGDFSYREDALLGGGESGAAIDFVWIRVDNGMGLMWARAECGMRGKYWDEGGEKVGANFWDAPLLRKGNGVG